MSTSTSAASLARPHVRRRRTAPASLRPRSLSCHPSQGVSRTAAYALLEPYTDTVESLDLPTSLPAALSSLRAFLAGHVREVEDRLKVISEDLESSSTDDTEDEEAPRQMKKAVRSQKNGLLCDQEQEETGEDMTLQAFVDNVKAYLAELKADLFSLEGTFLELSPSTLDTLDGILAHRLSISLPAGTLPDLRARFDDAYDSLSIPDAKKILATLGAHAEHIQEVLTQVSIYCRPGAGLRMPQSPISSTALAALYDSIPVLSLPDLPSMPSPPGLFPSPASLREYFIAESERISSSLPSFDFPTASAFGESFASGVSSTLRACREEARSALHEGEEYFHHEKERLKVWVDQEAEKFKLALMAGANRLLSYHELPHEWKNNKFILSGYRFIPMDRWGEILLSGLQWHNETINIHTHFIGSLSLLYLLFFVYPASSHSDPDSTLTDKIISLTFIFCAFKCMVCSAAWHLFSGCASLRSFKRFACVDYVGISGLITASVVCSEYYGFYCRRELAWAYVSFSTVMGSIGMVLPFRPWFDGPGSKPIRITFFVGLSCSALVPILHMSALYGFKETIRFFQPMLPSLFSYLFGLVFYATNYPERLRPGGVFDHLGHSHQFWHLAILMAVWLHWSAIGTLHEVGRREFSCAAPDERLWRKTVQFVETVVASAGAADAATAAGWGDRLAETVAARWREYL